MFLVSRPAFGSLNLGKASKLSAGRGGTNRRGRRRLAIGRAEKAEEIRFWADDHARFAAFQPGLIGLHRAIESKKIRILAERLGENAVSFRVAFAPGLVGLALRVAEQHDHIAIGLGFNGLLLLGAFGAKFRRLARAFTLHPAENLFGNLPWQIGV